MGWNDHFLDAGEDDKEEDVVAEVLKDMRKSDAYKVGFLRSAIRTAISMLEGNHVSEALSMLKASYKTESMDK
jgi:hypothetical protein